MQCVPIATRLELTRENKKMSLEDQIKDILFDMTTTIKFHKVTNDNVIMEVDYEKYVKLILGVIDSTPETLEQIWEPSSLCVVLAKVSKQCLVLCTFNNSA